MAGSGERKECAASPHMDMVWACFMQITNLSLAVAHLEQSKFINVRTRLRTRSCKYARVEKFFMKSLPVPTDMK